MNPRGGSSADMIRALNFDGATLKKSPSGHHLNLEMVIVDDSEEDTPKAQNEVVLQHVNLEKRKQSGKAAMASKDAEEEQVPTTQRVSINHR